MVFAREVVVLSEGPWPLGNVSAELLERVCHPGGDDGQIRDRLGVADDSDVQLARVGKGADVHGDVAPYDADLVHLPDSRARQAQRVAGRVRAARVV